MGNALTLSATITIIYITALTISAELYAPLKTFLSNSFSHHWIGKSITSIVVFAVFLVLFMVLRPKSKAPTLLNLLSTVSILSAVVLFAFFTWETLK